MNKLSITVLLSLFIISVWTSTKAQSSYWKKKIIGDQILYQLDEGLFKNELRFAPAETDLKTIEDGFLIELPSISGQMEPFRVYETPIFGKTADSSLIIFKTYTGVGDRNSNLKLKLEVSPYRISGYILDGKSTTWILNSTSDFLYSVEKKQQTLQDKLCISPESYSSITVQKNKSNFAGELYIYRLALTASGEYTQFWGDFNSTLAALVSTVNRMNAILERDLAIRFQLIDDIKFTIFDDPLNDPFELNGNQNVQNQQFLDRNVGSNNYDIGHLLMIDDVASGFGAIGSVCLDGQKGSGFSILPDPSDDHFIIDFLIHELGHQLGGNHTFSHCGNIGGGPIPVEPGSGSTVMAYGGLPFCEEDNFVNNSDDYFHSKSIEEIYNYTRNNAGNACPTIINFPNSKPEIKLSDQIYVIPAFTPFELSPMEVKDADGDTLSFSWEQVDQEVQLPLGQIVEGSPLFRSRPPVAFSTRAFPTLYDLIENKSQPEEKLPDFSGALKFRLTVRDNHFRGGGISWEEIELEVTDQAGPFRVISLSEPETWALGSTQTISWEVANTNQAPVGIQHVDIYFMLDSMGNENVLLAESIPNTGEAIVQIPDNLPTGKAYLKIKGHNSIFFDLSDAQVTLDRNTFSKEEVVEAKKIEIFPNPLNHQFYIKKLGNGFIGKTQLKLLDLLGRERWSTEFWMDSNLQSFELPESIGSGIYYLSIVFSDQTWTQNKLMVIR